MLYGIYEKAANNILGTSYSTLIEAPKENLIKVLNEYNIDSIIDVENCINKLSYGRVIHIINMFLSGESFFCKLVKYKDNNKNTEELLYEWFLLALVHDLAYVYETYAFSEQYHSLADVCMDMNISTYFSDLKNNAFYSSQTFANYFKYKRDQLGVCDHGIIAGLLFINKFKTDKKIPKLELSYIIAAHNMFIASKKREFLYKEYNLWELIPDSKQYKCISANDKYGYYFLIFCLIDILEPISTFDCSSINEVYGLLDTISYEILDNSIVIKTTHRSQIQIISQRIYDIPIWLNVSLNIISDREIIITIK